MFGSIKLSDFNFILDYKKLFSYKVLVVFGYIALIFNLLIQFSTNIITSWTGQLFVMLFINFLGIFFVFIFLLVYILLFGFIIVDLTLLFSKRNREENTKEEKKNSIIFLVLNLLISLYALWYLGFNILIILFLAALICLIKYLISQKIEKRGIFIRLGILLIFLLLISSGIVEGIIFDKGQWTTKYLFNNKIIENVNLLNNEDEVLFITKPQNGQSEVFNQKLYIYDLNSNRFLYNIVLEKKDILNDAFLSLDSDEKLIITKKYIDGKSVINISIYNLRSKELKDIKNIARKNSNEEIVLLKNGHVLILPTSCRSCENYEVYNPYKNEIYHTKNAMSGYIDVKNIKIFSNGNLLIPSAGRFYVYDAEKKTFNRGASININEKCALYKDEYIFNFKSGYKYSLSENKKIKIKRKTKLNVQKAIALDNGNFIIIGSETMPKIFWKYNPKAPYFQSKETYKIYLYITKYDYYVQLKSNNPIWKPDNYYNALKLRNGNVLFWSSKDGFIEIYKQNK